MTLRPPVIALLFFASAAAQCGAQTYSTPRPVPRTTSVPELRALAVRREIQERFTLGINDLRHAQWTQGAAEFERIVSLRPPEPQASTAHYDLGIAYANLQRLENAAAQFRSAIAGDPGFLAAMANLVAVDLARHDLAEARAVADRFVAAAPDSARALYSRGIVALNSGANAAAEADFGRLLSVDPRYAVAHYDLGLAQTKLGKYASAAHEFSMALDLAPNYARARFALATILLRQGNRSEARSAFQRVVDDPNGDPALRNLAIAMRDAINI